VAEQCKTCIDFQRRLIVNDQRHAEHEAHAPSAAPGERCNDDGSDHQQETDRREEDVENARKRSGHGTITARPHLPGQAGTNPFGTERWMFPDIRTVGEKERDDKVAAIGQGYRNGVRDDGIQYHPQEEGVPRGAPSRSSNAFQIAHQYCPPGSRSIVFKRSFGRPANRPKSRWSMVAVKWPGVA
jgi:hypothetical protein